MSQSLTQAAFAEEIGVKRSYITQLKKEGRLVMQDGKVLVDESIELINNTKDPSKAGVVARHAKERESKQEPARAIEAIDDDGSSFNFWKTKNEKRKFLDADRESQVRSKELFEVADVKMAVLDSDAIIRNRLESMPDLLAPQLAIESDEHKVRLLLMDQIEWLLSELSKGFNEMSA